MLIPYADRGKYLDNLIGGLAMVLAGPFALRLAFHSFLVLVGVLILSGAVNTAIIGSNGALSRVAEDGILPPWFRAPHPKHGTAHHIINVIVGLQLLTILLSRGNVDMLGEAYAFGVVWSFAMKGLAVVILRFTHPEAKRWKFPFNLRVGDVELPLGLLCTTAILFMMAIMNLFTKKAATISCSIFTIVFFTAFTLSERKYAKQQKENGIRATPHADDPFPRHFARALPTTGRTQSICQLARSTPRRHPHRHQEAGRSPRPREGSGERYTGRARCHRRPCTLRWS